MKLSHLRALAILAFCLTLVGCPKKSDPSASDTVLGPPTSMRGQEGDFIGGDGVYREGGDFLAGSGLEERGSGFNAIPTGADRRAIAIQSIFFGFDEQSIRPEERVKVERAVERMRSEPNLRIICEGHTDWIGTEEYNLGLGDRRANSVKTYMVQLGVNPNRIEILSMGEMDATPDVHRDSPQARDDRRVDLIPVR